MTRNEAIARVKKIDAIKDDDEQAHIEEDELYADVLRYYAEGGTDPEVARETLKTASIRFSRWCA